MEECIEAKQTLEGNNSVRSGGRSEQETCSGGAGACAGAGERCFQMPVHYPRYSREAYEAMPEWKLDCLLAQYGLPVAGDLAYKRSFAIGAFLWPSTYLIAD